VRAVDKLIERRSALAQQPKAQPGQEELTRALTLLCGVERLVADVTAEQIADRLTRRHEHRRGLHVVAMHAADQIDPVLARRARQKGEHRRLPTLPAHAVALAGKHHNRHANVAHGAKHVRHVARETAAERERRRKALRVAIGQQIVGGGGDQRAGSALRVAADADCRRVDARRETRVCAHCLRQKRQIQSVLFRKINVCKKPEF
jgi:hypothetical protein